MEKLVEVQDLVLRFYTYEGVVKALEGVNVFIKKGETLGIVGETGCGKTMTGLSILRLIPAPGRIEGGRIIFKTQDGPIDLLTQKDSVLTKIRGKDISMIFQEPSSALNPTITVTDQISEVFTHHRLEELIEKVLEGIEEDIQNGKGMRARIYKLEKKIYKKRLKNPHAISIKLLARIPVVNTYRRRLKEEVRKEVVNILGEMRIPDPERVADMYPHELSGGMQQRVVIAMGLACNPMLLTADEPTTSLDVTIQAQILELLKTLKKQFKSSILYITHDMGVIAELSDRVAVMYAGTVCEVADVLEIFKNPLHPYTEGLLKSIPRPGKEFKSIVGTVPDLINPPSGCRFHPRCSKAMPMCSEIAPKIIEVRKDHFVSCHLQTGSAK